MPEMVVITGAKNDFKLDLPNLSKLTEPLINVPQTIDVISGQELKDRAVTNFNDAIKHIPGISIGAGEFSWQGNNPSIRGFVARTDMFLDGLRDFGDYYRDPYNLENIQVLEGPASVLFGRGSTGGVINQASKMPTLDGFIDATVVGGTDYMRRAVVDIDEAVPELGDDTALRLNAMVHAQSVSDRNEVKQNRFGVAPTLAFGLGTPTRLTFSYFDQTSNDIPDYGLPWFGTKVAPVPRQNFYGFSDDHLHTGTDVGTFKIEHDLTPDITLRNTVRYAYYTRDFRISEPIISQPTTTPLSMVNVGFNIWSGNSVETMAWDQAEAAARFNTFGLDNSLVAGVEGGRESSSPEFDNSVGVPTVPLLHPDPNRKFTATATYPRLKADTIAYSYAFYAMDTVKLGRFFELNGGIRWDSFDAHYRATRYSTTDFGMVTGHDNVQRTDRMPSYRAAIVFKPVENGSIYFDYGTSFNPSAEALSQITSGRGLGIGNSDLAPERNETYEFGTKWNLLNDMITATASVFRLEKDNARVPDPTDPTVNILAGLQKVDGAEVSLTGHLTEDWQVTGGYAYLEGEVLKSAPGAAPKGSSLPNAPKNSFSAFTEYNLGGGFEIGGGGTYTSSRLAQNTAPLKRVPGYFLLDAMVKYNISERMSLQLNVNNILDKYYYEALHTFHVVPGEGRVALLTLNFRQ